MKKIDFIFVDKRTDPAEGIPMFCSICNFALRTYEDRTSFEEKKCCYKCGITFADSRLDEWKSGWRPSNEDVKKEIEKRLEIPVSIDLSLVRDS